MPILKPVIFQKKETTKPYLIHVSVELEMLGTESFELEDERPSYLDELSGPATSKIGTDKVAEKEIGDLQ